MSRRYGRNQRRLARVKIAQLEARLESERAARMKAEISERTSAARAADAYDRAFQFYADRHGLIEAVTSRMGNAMGHALGEKLLPHAQRLMDAQCRQPRPFSLRLNASPVVSEVVETVDLRGEIPALSYHIRVAKW